MHYRKEILLKAKQIERVKLVKLFFYIKFTITSELIFYYYLHLLIALINSKKYLNKVYPKKEEINFLKIKKLDFEKILFVGC